LFIGATFVAMENHRTDSIPNDSYPVKSDRLLAGPSNAGGVWGVGTHTVGRRWKAVGRALA